MFSKTTKKFKANPTTYYALSICATWAGIGSLMNGVVITQTYGIIPSLIWVTGNTIACILFGSIAIKIPKVCEVFKSKFMMWLCGIMCIFQSWLSMNGMQSVFADTVLGARFGTIVAYAESIIFLIILFRFGMIRNVLTDDFGWLIVYAMAVGITLTALIHSRGNLNTISLGLNNTDIKAGIWKSILLLPGPFTYPYFFHILEYNEKNDDGAKRINAKKAFTLGGIFFGIYMLIVFLLAWVQFSPVLNLAKAALITLIGTSTLSSAMYSIYIAFGKKAGLTLNIGLIAFWHILIPLGVIGAWSLMANIRIFIVGGAIAYALIWNYISKRKAVLK